MVVVPLDAMAGMVLGSQDEAIHPVAFYATLRGHVLSARADELDQTLAAAGYPKSQARRQNSGSFDSGSGSRHR